MARPMSLKPFYAVLGGIAVVGAGWLAYSGRRSSGAAQLEPVPAEAVAAADAFPGHVLGSDSAPIEVVEYADFQCPACAQFAILTMHDVKERLIQTGRVRWRFRDFPLEIHDKSQLAHHSAACAGEQTQFWAMHDQLYYNQSRWYGERPAAAGRMFRDFARTIGLDVGAYDSCMESSRYRARIAASAQQGISQGVASTPTFIIDGRRVAGSMAYDPLHHMIDSLIALKQR
ncbi:MAG: hypothetical protein A2W29_09010 [Gemmatimonadetes bacterium RBG_16_66_8]|nr:MAG: hypothetical protein A2W29_09010 [Gemmatimonadetes bacterium RBG_16_66_8]